MGNKTPNNVARCIRAYEACIYANRVTLSPIHTNTLINKDKVGDKRGDKRGDIGVTN